MNTRDVSSSVIEHLTLRYLPLEKSGLGFHQFSDVDSFLVPRRLSLQHPIRVGYLFIIALLASSSFGRLGASPVGTHQSKISTFFKHTSNSKGGDTPFVLHRRQCSLYYYGSNSWSSNSWSSHDGLFDRPPADRQSKQSSTIPNPSPTLPGFQRPDCLLSTQVTR